jgi:hypothetical protein
VIVFAVVVVALPSVPIPADFVFIFVIFSVVLVIVVSRVAGVGGADGTGGAAAPGCVCCACICAAAMVVGFRAAMTALIAAAGRNIPVLLTKLGRAGKAELQNQTPACVKALEQRLVRQRAFVPAHSARQLQSRHSSFGGLF